MVENLQGRPIYANQELDGHEEDAASNLRDDIEEEHLSDYEIMISNRRVVQSLEQHQKGGQDVILYSVVRQYGVPVAKATIQTTNLNDTVAGTRLGVQFYGVVTIMSW